MRCPGEGSKWAPPIHNEIKINFDAAVNNKGGMVGIEYVIARDCEGKVLVAKARTLLYHWSPELCEARAALEAIYMAKDEGYNNIILEGVAQVIIRALQEQIPRGGDTQLVVEDIRAYRTSFSKVSFNFCYKECTLAAHRLAQWVVHQYCEEVWYGEGPEWIYEIIVADSYIY
ncbi:Cytochrome P450 monooxygenase ltmK [Bienertia sinuspersici]